MKRFYGKYIGTVINNEDPDKIGRLKVRVPCAYGNISEDDIPWAEPDLPFSSENQSILFIPDIGSLVSVEFLDGCTYTPIWCGAIHRKDENVIPDEAVTNYPNVKIIKTKAGYIKMDDTETVIEIKHKSGSSIIFTNDGDIILHAKRDIIPYADRYFLGMPRGCEAAVAIPDYKNNTEKATMTEEELTEYNQTISNYNASVSGNCGKNGSDLYNTSSISSDEIQSVVTSDSTQQSQIVSSATSKATNNIGSISSLSDITGSITKDVSTMRTNNATSLGVENTPSLSSFSSMTMIVNDGDINIER